MNWWPVIVVLLVAAAAQQCSAPQPDICAPSRSPADESLDAFMERCAPELDYETLIGQ